MQSYKPKQIVTMLRKIEVRRSFKAKGTTEVVPFLFREDYPISNPPFTFQHVTGGIGGFFGGQKSRRACDGAGCPTRPNEMAGLRELHLDVFFDTSAL
jgi:hypothetical protein